MTKRIATQWTDAIIRCDEKQASRRAVILYGMELLISTFIGIGLIAVISLLAHETLAWVFFLLAFAPLRHTAGGFHANTHFQCYMVFSGVFTLVIVLEKTLLITTNIIWVITIISTFIVCALAPCVPNNKPINEEGRKRNRKFSCILIWIDFLSSTTILLTRIDRIILHYYYWGVLSAAVSLVVAKIKNYQGECTNENKNS